MKGTLYVDGGSRGNPGPAASGAILYDERGERLDEIGVFLGVTTNNVAEWTALIEGIKMALAHGIDELSIRMDSELVVRQLLGKYRVKNETLIQLHKEAKALLRRFSSAKVAHVRREANAAADAVVNQVLDAQQ